ncbi:MAG: hypothetical protein GX231_00445 [Tissierellia bacterium]|nr:hypothetical protein [Tissierellia bacterium]
MKSKTNCDNCVYYDFDDELDYYVCMMKLDQDEMEQFMNYRFDNCPYFKLYDEYKTVKKQN